MKTFNKIAAQGEIAIRRIDTMPKGVAPMADERGKCIVGHSETGHNHVMERDGARFFEATDAPAGMRILYAILDKPNVLSHQRDFDTHEAIAFEPGMYEFRLGREYDPYAKWSRAQAD
jgi:hypothetical protein